MDDTPAKLVRNLTAIKPVYAEDSAGLPSCGRQLEIIIRIFFKIGLSCVQ